jgi:monothiol glutaredoxin
MNNPFNVIGQGQQVQEANPTADTQTRIKEMLNTNDIFLFMKGNPSMPQCGFSANVVGILNNIGANYQTFDVLSDWDIREGVKQFSNWPTYPQLYVKGKLVGGNDVISELFDNGELEAVLKG